MRFNHARQVLEYTPFVTHNWKGTYSQMINSFSRVLQKSSDDTRRFRYVVFSGMKESFRELIIVRLPHPYTYGPELNTLAKSLQKELQEGKASQWEHVVYLGGFGNVCWSGTVTPQHLPPADNIYLIATEGGS